MNTPGWFILIYETAHADSQELVANELHDLGGLVVQTEQSNGEYFVIVESPETINALTLHEFVLSIDPDVELVDTHRGTAQERLLAEERLPSHSLEHLR